jgi:anti-anti-sigma factor
MERSNYIISTAYRDNIPVFTLEGEIGLNSTGNIRRRLDDAFLGIKGNTAVIDLKKVISVDSVGISSLIYFAKVLKEKKGRLVLAGLDNQMREIINILGVETWFEYADNVDDGLKMLLGS